MSLNLSPHKHKPGDCGILFVSAVEISDGTRDRVTLGKIMTNYIKNNIFLFAIILFKYLKTSCFNLINLQTATINNNTSCQILDVDFANALESLA